jgi:hypothetical protein
MSDRFDEESLNSEVDKDLWDEIPKYKDYKHELEMKKQKED